MEKLKSVFSPGSKADDDVLYGEGKSNNLGQVAGEGSHFGHSRTTDPSASTTGSATAPPDSTTTSISKSAATDTATPGTVPGAYPQSPPSDATKAAQLASKPHDQETRGISSSNTQDPTGTTAGLAASRADASHQKETLPDRTVGATGNPASQTGSELPIYDQYASDAKGTSGHPEQHTATTGTSYSNPYSSNTVDPRVDPSAKQTHKDHHIGRDVGFGGATAGAAVYEGDKLHEKHEPATQSSVQPSQSTSASNFLGSGTPGGAKPAEPQSLSTQEQPPVPKGTTAASYDPKTSSATYSAGDSSQVPQQGQHHYGRDAALGAGAGAVGIGGYEATKHHDTTAQPQTSSPVAPTQSSGAVPTGYDSQRGQPSTTGSGSYTAPPGTAVAGDETYDTQRADPPATGAGYYTAPHGTAMGNEKPTEHHYGRDAAIGAGTGAAGLGGYEALKHHDNNTQRPTDTSTSQQYPTQGAYGTHQPAPAGASAPGQAITTDTRQPAETARDQKSGDHHYGRDAAIGAGVAGAGGAAAYEAKKHEDEKKALEQQQREAKEHQKQLEAEQKEHAKEQKAAEKEHEKAVKQHEKEVKKEEKQHEKEVKKEEKQHEKEIKAAEKEHEKEVKAAEKEHEKEVKAAEAEREKRTKAMQAEQEKQAKEEERRRREMEAAGAAGVGAAGLAAGEHEHRKDKDDEDDKDGGKKKGGLLSSLLGRNKKDKDTDQEEPKDHHRGKEAAVGGGAVGAAALEKHEYDQHQQASQHTPQSQAPTTSQAYQTQSTQPAQTYEDSGKSHHYKEAAAGGAGLVGAGALGKHEYDQHHQAPSDASQSQTNPAGQAYQPTQSQKYPASQAYETQPAQPTQTYQDSGKPHHYKEEAAAGAGVLGAGALGKHEYDQHRQAPLDTSQSQVPAASQAYQTQPSQSQTYPAGQAYQTQPGQVEQTYDNRTQPHHHKEDAGLGAGALGAGAIGKHEYDQHHQAPQYTSQPQATTASQPPYQTQPSQPTQAYQDSGKPHHYKEDALGGAGVLGAGALGKHEYDQHHQAPQYASQTQTATAGQPPYQTQSSQPTHAYEDNGKPHHYKEDAAAGAGVLGAGALGKHESDKHHQTTQQPSQTQATYGQPSQYTDAREQQPKTHHKEEAAAGAGVLGAGALGKHEYDQHHGKTDKDIAAEKRNDIPVVGALHREGRFHGKEGGAPGAVGVPPDQRDEAYIDSQKQSHGAEPKKHGILDSILHRHKDDKDDKAIESTSSQGDRHRLHKDPPGDHPAANMTDPTTGLPIDTSKGPHDGRGTDGLPHGHHSEKLADNADVNVQHQLHDPANMGYGATESGKYNL